MTDDLCSFTINIYTDPSTTNSHYRAAVLSSSSSYSTSLVSKHTLALLPDIELDQNASNSLFEQLDWEYVRLLGSIDVYGRLVKAQVSSTIDQTRLYVPDTERRDFDIRLSVSTAKSLGLNGSKRHLDIVT